MGLTPDGPLPEAAPGQFFMFGIQNCEKDPLLKRPFCYFRKKGGTLEILYRVVGKMTSMMKGLRPGDEVEVLGPLGNVYPLEEAECKTPLVIAGGVGIASVYPLLEGLKGKAYLFYGGRSKPDILLATELKALSKKFIPATDDGSLGFKGTAVDAAKNFLFLKSRNLEDFILYSCGPNGMLKAASSLGVSGYIASEEKMACGIGVCLGCAVKTKEGYKRACKDGPVFKTGELIFD